MGAAVIACGAFINVVINFLIVSFIVFLLVKQVNRWRRQKEVPAPAPTTKQCTFCYTAIPIKAVRCLNCTSELKTT